MKFKKEFILKRQGYDPVKVVVKINDNNIYIRTFAEIHFLDLAHLLCEKTPLLEVVYERSAPYKLVKTKHREGDKFSYKEYGLTYLLIKDGIIKEETKHLINLHTVNTKVKGTRNMFIPDLLLVMQDYGYVKETGSGKFKAARKFSDHVVFEDLTFSPENLRNQGFIIPKKYEEKFALKF
ncbi:hypothetical protein AF332_11495 [Sporosarcina globispora]|uniref:Uncharacterized protein n=1 Tax=Sporosarcina globispora TaxID=1459 RepID=A0A0M0GC93_SPOGL|nr:hypothetical protein [Sporosarcina globispora]KON87388.1 hypothetical protein AF332_11495 [Sporosarcina globispora]